jgi:hypothetical protein
MKIMGDIILTYKFFFFKKKQAFRVGVLEYGGLMPLIYRYIEHNWIILWKFWLWQLVALERGHAGFHGQPQEDRIKRSTLGCLFG